MGIGHLSGCGLDVLGASWSLPKKEAEDEEARKQVSEPEQELKAWLGVI